ncbi:MAG: hypothetical protein LH470_02040 [Lysobacter sp.]|nr:hypothetical protein [Lysobacter sp.]
MSALKLLLPEDPLERLNYFNSQRLEAIDFRLEQAYHIRVRRWLNRTLYSAGIGAGLEVTIDPIDKHAVIVSPGLALDWLGRETILLNERKVMACGTPRRADGVTFGNYLVIAYREEKVAPQSDGCRVQGVYDTGLDACGCTRSALDTNSCNGGCGCHGCKSGGGQCGTTGAEAYAWGAPSRIRSEPLLMFQDSWPTESSGKILLAQVEMDAQCVVIGVKSGMRRYASASKPPTTTPVSLEGEKDIDKDNPKVLRFHIEGGYPDTALLYLQGFKFSSLYYSEMGQHKHGIHGTLSEVSRNFKHTHALTGEAETLLGGKHAHQLMLNDGNDQDGVDRENRGDCDWTWNIISDEGEHTHKLASLSLNEQLDEWKHTHTFTGGIDNAGVTNAQARDGAGQIARTYVKTLLVSFDGMDITTNVLAQLEALNPGSWAELGNGGGSHELVKNGTGPIDLRQIDGVDLSPGTAHTLIFAVASGGGQLHYNLYVS